ncbi:MAG: thrombospondin type 3 repeat-containing protein, partial [Planctomycetes bacterium]|nr:thrombospondin type 3 repeat-containing protein [Planctomycetota bacterium]
MWLRIPVLVGTLLFAVPVRADGIVACWRFNENGGLTAGDLSGNNIHGTLLGSPTSPGWTPGIHYSGLLFGDAIDYVQFEHNDLFNFTTGFTISFYIKAAPGQIGSGEGIATILDKSHGAVDFTGWAVEAHAIDNAAISFALGTNTSIVEPRIGGVLDNSWHHVAITVNLEPELRIRGYRDGTLVTDFADTSTFIANNARPLLIGAFWNGPTGPLARQFAGILDEVRIYDRLLTQCELNGLMNLSEPEDCDGNWLHDPCTSDIDDDSIIDVCDNCPLIPNYDQSDCDLNGIGDACEPDSDGDGAADPCDNCPLLYNPTQWDCDTNGVGDACQIADCVFGDSTCTDCNSNDIMDPCELNDELVKLVKPNPAANNDFGFSVAISGDTAIVGSDSINSGTARVFVFLNDTIIYQANLVGSSIAADDQFGYAVAISGSTAVVGVPSDDHSDTFNAGSARVFVRTGNIWNQQSTLTTPGIAPYDRFGYSVAIDGDTILV